MSDFNNDDEKEKIKQNILSTKEHRSKMEVVDDIEEKLSCVCGQLELMRAANTSTNQKTMIDDMISKVLFARGHVFKILN